MLPVQFFGQNLHFAISLFAGLVCFAVFWLYFDAWIGERYKAKKDILKWLGFLLAALSFVTQATIVEQSVLGHSIFGNLSENIAIVLRVLGYLGIILGQLFDPLQRRPKTSEPEVEEEPGVSPPSAGKATAVLVAGAFGLVYSLPVLALAVAILYWRRATTGLERHLKPVAVSFFLLTLFELAFVSHHLRASSNPSLANLVRAFGPIWIAEHLLLLVGVVLLGCWVWRYLTERFLSQLFMVFTTAILVIFLLTTVSFTYLLMHNVQNQALSNLETAAHVLNYALGSKQAETGANALAVAEDPDVAQAVINKDHKTLVALTDNFLATKKQSSLLIVDQNGQVLLRAEDPERWGDSLSSDTQLRRALVGETTASLGSKDDVLAPLMYIKTATPIRDKNKQIVGAVTSGLVIGNALVDGIKHDTGLDSAVYSGNVRSATTFLAADGVSRWIGVKETSKAVQQQVLKQGQTFKGTLNVLNRPYLAVYVPLKDVDDSVVGMLFIGEPQTDILQTAGHSIELTFLVAATLLIVAITPAYLVARQLARQLD